MVLQTAGSVNYTSKVAGYVFASKLVVFTTFQLKTCLMWDMCSLICSVEEMEYWPL